MYLCVYLKKDLTLSKRKNKNKHKQKPKNYYVHQTKDPKQINDIALKVFGSLYYNPSKTNI
jgi:hypothetical protein